MPAAMLIRSAVRVHLCPWGYLKCSPLITFKAPAGLGSSKGVSTMAKCSSCGKNIGSSKSCPHCGQGPSQSVMSKGVRSMGKVTADVIDTGIDVTEKVVKGAKPVVRTVLDAGKRGARKARDEAKRIAKDLKED